MLAKLTYATVPNKVISIFVSSKVTSADVLVREKVTTSPHAGYWVNEGNYICFCELPIRYVALAIALSTENETTWQTVTETTAVHDPD